MNMPVKIVKIGVGLFQRVMRETERGFLVRRLMNDQLRVGVKGCGEDVMIAKNKLKRDFWMRRKKEEEGVDGIVENTVEEVAEEEHARGFEFFQ